MGEPTKGATAASDWIDTLFNEWDQAERQGDRAPPYGERVAKISAMIDKYTQAPAMRALLERCLAMSDSGESWECILHDIKTLLGEGGE